MNKKVENVTKFDVNNNTNSKYNMGRIWNNAVHIMKSDISLSGFY